MPILVGRVVPYPFDADALCAASSGVFEYFITDDMADVAANLIDATCPER